MTMLSLTNKSDKSSDLFPHNDGITIIQGQKCKKAAKKTQKICQKWQ